MDTVIIMVLLAALAAALSLGVGVFAMAMGGDFDERYSVQLMVARVAFQGVALVLIVVAIYLGTTG